MKRTLIWTVIVVLIIIGLLALLSGPLVRFSLSSFETPTKEGAPTGSLFISSVTDSGFLFLDTYVLDVGTGDFTIVESDSESQTSMYTLSSDGDAVTFLGTSKSLVDDLIAKKERGDPMQVYRTTFNQTAPVLPTISQAEKLTDDTTVQKSVPVISSDGSSILYVETPVDQQAVADMSVEGRTIQLISDASQNHNTISVEGMYPQWYDPDHFYYIAKDGVRLYNIEKRNSTLVLPISGQSNFKIAVSHDARKLAFANPDANSVFVYDISAEGTQLTLAETITIQGYWVVFSPDDQFMAIQTDTNGTPQIAIYDTLTFTQVGQSIPLSPLLNDRLFVTTWAR